MAKRFPIFITAKIPPSKISRTYIVTGLTPTRNRANAKFVVRTKSGKTVVSNVKNLSIRERLATIVKRR